MALKTDYKDAAWSGDRLYKITDAGSGKSTIEDVTSYTVSGDSFGAKDINATNKAVNDLLDKMTTLGKSVSDGKTLVAAAITAKKVAATASDSFATLAEKIGQIVLGSGNATAADVLKGKTFTNSGGVELAGTMPDHSAKDSLGGINSTYPNVPIHKGTYGQFCTPTGGSERLFAVRPDKGYWNGDTYVAAPATTKTVTPSTAQQTAYPDSGGVLEKVVVGAIPNQRGQSQKSAKCYTYKHTDGVTYLVNWLLAGWYSAWQPTSGGTATYAEVWTKQADVASALGITANKIKKGTTICGITGTWEGYVAGNGDLYNKGALGLGGGFTAIPYYGDSESGAAGYMKGAGALSYDAAQMRVDGCTVCLTSNQAVNLSAYSKLNVTFRWNKGTNNFRMQATYNKPGCLYGASNNVAASVATSGANNQAVTASLDISSINANCYISFGCISGNSNGDAQMLIDRVWLS
ncbi:hypothetical protein [Brotaphodocola sp.]|uniref:hypothetical protein n=1 Tax=Brotaphodocola sp. TaxID=3073577 RepID=UPI003D7C639E